jgi:hypothetical protein
MEAVGCLIFLCILYIETKMLWSKAKLLYFVSFVTLLTSLILAFTWYNTWDGSSVFLLMGMTVGEIVGWVQYILVIPWIVRNYNPRMVSPFIAGNGLMIWILVTVEIIQQPGGWLQFSAMVYFLIAAVIYATTTVVCVYTFESGIAKLTLKEGLKSIEPWQTSLKLQFLPTGWRATKHLIFARIWGEVLTWSVAPIALPLAAANTTSTSDGENYLEWAITVGLLSMLVGFLSSYFVTEKFWIFESLVVATFANGVILLAAANVGDWSSWAMRTILMIAVALTRMAFAWSIPLIFRETERRYPENSEALVRLNSLWALVALAFFKPIFWAIATVVIS